MPPVKQPSENVSPPVAQYSWASDPTVWLLLGSRTGDNVQVESLAEALAWPFQTFHLHYNPLRFLPNWMLGATRATIRQCTPAFAPPWPDLVLGVGQRSVAPATWIKAAAGGRPFLVQLGRPRAPLNWFDLLVTTPQYGLPGRANVLQNLFPLHSLTPDRLSQAAETWRPRIGGCPRPWFTVLVGGPSGSYRMDVAAARRIAAIADAEARAAGGSLLVVTAPRTPPAVADVIGRTMTVPHVFHRWDQARGEDNPYAGFIALADRIFVTEESVSMLGEACAARVPVTVLPLPRRPGVAACERIFGAPGHDLLARTAEQGVFTPVRRVAAVHDALVSGGLAAWDRHGLQVAAGRLPEAHDPVLRTVARIRELIGE